MTSNEQLINLSLTTPTANHVNTRKRAIILICFKRKFPSKSVDNPAPQLVWPINIHPFCACWHKPMCCTCRLQGNCFDTDARFANNRHNTSGQNITECNLKLSIGAKTVLHALSRCFRARCCRSTFASPWGRLASQNTAETSLAWTSTRKWKEFTSAFHLIANLQMTTGSRGTRAQHSGISLEVLDWPTMIAADRLIGRFDYGYARKLQRSVYILNQEIHVLIQTTCKANALPWIIISVH